MRFFAALIFAMAAVTGTAHAAGDGGWEGIEPFTLHDTALQATMHVNSHCNQVWDVLTIIEKLQELAPHLNITSPVVRAHERGDYINTAVIKEDHVARGKFVLLTPVPFNRVDAVVQPDKGPWMRIQVWEMNPVSGDDCRVDYSESYNEIWLKQKRIDGTPFIAENRDHHIHVILRRIKRMAEGKAPGDEAEYAYLFEDARTFPKPFQRPRQASR